MSKTVLQAAIGCVLLAAGASLISSQRFSAASEGRSRRAPTDSDMHSVTLISGPIKSAVEVAAMGEDFQKYEDDFRRYSQFHWTKEQDSWEQANYYDRAKIFYVWWIKTADAGYLSRADKIALNYRRDYLEKNNYGTSAHWSQLAGIAIHFILTGDESSRTALHRVTQTLINPYYLANLGNTSETSEMDNRQQARVLTSLLYTWKVETRLERSSAPDDNTSAYIPTDELAALLRSSLTTILSSQSADGGFHFRHGGQCGFNKPFMVGLLLDALAEYYDGFEADPRIIKSVQKALDYLSEHNWLPDQQAFQYLEGKCGVDQENAPVAAPDLNNLVSSSFGWIYQKTRIAAYRSMGEAVFTGGVRKAWLEGSKQFNENYTSSYKYPAYR